MSTNNMPPPGWYPDPQRRGRRRWWDGYAWTEDRRLTGAAVAKRGLGWSAGGFAGLLALVVVLGLVFGGPSTTPASADGSSPTHAPSAAPSTRASAAAAPTPSRTNAPPRESRPPRSTAPSMQPRQRAAHRPPQKAPVSRSPATKSAPNKTVNAAPAGSALVIAENLAVKGRAAKTGYSREQFGSSWEDIDHNGCDQRNDILNRDLTHKTFDGCTVLSGILHDPYTGKVIAFHRGIATSRAVQIDHVVALSDAWQKGAQQWSYGKRVQFANDPLNLLAVDGPTNAAKGDGDTATWLPPNKTYRCAYVGRQVAVKHRYGAWVTTAEKSAMVQVLSRCPTLRLPTAGPVPPRPVIQGPPPAAQPTHTTPPAPHPKPTPTRTTQPPAAPYEGVVHPGSFCAPEGGRGVTTKGTPMRCTLKPGEDRARWRSG